MSEIDLVPPEYRRRQQRDSALRRLGAGALAIVVAGVAAAGGLAWAGSRAQAQLTALDMARRMSDQQRVELGNLETERVRLEEQWNRLQALRGAGDVDALFLLIDHALPEGELWFDGWEMSRDDVESGGAAQMRIVGQARDHAALSHFVRGLYESPGVSDVHLERTGLRRYTTTSVVDFELAVLLAGDA